MTYRKEIDGLRAIAILPVLLFHAGFDLASGGFVGVDVFFVISGYLITALILNEMEAGSFSLIRFYERRARRILPALFFVMLCCVPFAWAWLLPSDLHALADSMIAVVLFIANIHFHREAGYFAPDADQQPLLHTWSLSIEEQFYLLFPLILIACWRVGRPKLFAIVAALAAISLLLAQFGGNLSFHGDFIHGRFSFTAPPTYGFYLLQTRAWELLAGALAAFWLHGKDATRQGHDILALAGLSIILYGIVAFDEGTPHPSFHTLLPVGGTALIILYATPKTLCARLLSLPFLVGIGLISYSVYLWHQPLFAFLRLQSPSEPSDTAFLLLALLSLALGWLSWCFIERPFRDRQRFSRKEIVSYAGAGAALMVGIGMTGHAYDGFLSRYPPKERHLIVAADSELMGRYVYKRYRDLLNHPFDPKASLKILIVGDSFAQDVVNMLVETGSLDHASLSTYELSPRCGNLYVQTDFLSHIEPDDRAKCLREGWYDDPQTLENLRQADVIIVTSSWSQWVADLLPESIDNLKKDFDGRVVLIGRKFFGDVRPNHYIGMADDEKKALRNSILGQHTDVNKAMVERFDRDIFVDVSRLFCGSETDCPVFTPDLKLISYDGGHLTRDGAIYLGQKLRTHPLIREALQLDGARLAKRDEAR